MVGNYQLKNYLQKCKFNFTINMQINNQTISRVDFINFGISKSKSSSYITTITKLCSYKTIKHSRGQRKIVNLNDAILAIKKAISNLGNTRLEQQSLSFKIELLKILKNIKRRNNAI